MRVSSNDIQKDFDKYLNLAIIGEEVIVTEGDNDVLKIVSCNPDDVIVEEVASNCINKSKISYDEFIQLTENSELRYELIDGELYFLGSPNFLHQKIVGRLIFHLSLWFRDEGCQPLTAPFDVTLTKNQDNINVVQPDIIVICDTENIDDKGKYYGVPTLVIEVVSKSTRYKDMVKKLDLYMQSGVKEYWIVDPENKSVQVYDYREAHNGKSKTFNDNDTVISIQFPGLEVKANDLFS